MRVLGIETSCDDTGLALYDSNKGLLAHVIHSQTIHQRYGGVVPELASRDHCERLVPLLTQVLEEGNTKPEEITGIAYTAGPGLVGALMVGASFAKTLSFAWNIPAIGIHHLEGHLLAPMLEPKAPSFPFVTLLVSGGHTQLIDVQGIGQYHLLGDSLDDAAGESFDKIAKLLGLGYPGGRVLAELALKGNPDQFDFPKPLTDKPGLDFSFSGLKTHALNTWKSSTQTEQDKADIAYAFQKAVVDTLYIKCERALKITHSSTLVVAGGVGANQSLREKLYQLPLEVYFPRPEFCTDNGAMIAYAGYERLRTESNQDLAIQVHPRWPISSLEKP